MHLLQTVLLLHLPLVQMFDSSTLNTHNHHEIEIFITAPHLRNAFMFISENYDKSPLEATKSHIVCEL